MKKSTYKTFLTFVNKILIMFINDLLWLFSLVFPKNKYKWIFGAWFGKSYSGSSKYLYEYIIKNHPNIRCIWITKNKLILDYLRKRGKESYYFLSLNGLWHAFTGKVYFFCCSKSDINSITCSFLNLKVNLWHGTPIKKIMYDDNIAYDRNSFYFKCLKFCFPYLRDDFDLVISPSKLVRSIYASAFRLPNEKLPIIGDPRNDILANVSNDVHREHMVERKGLTILYAPTHRCEGKDSQILNVLPLGSEWNILNQYLSECNSCLKLRLHYYDKKYLPTNLDEFPNIKIDTEMDAQIALLNTDILITDYSSIFLDYLLLDRPVIFTVFDLQKYLLCDRQMYFKYDEITPGPKAKNWREVIQCLDQYFLNPSAYQDGRDKICSMFIENNDGLNSCRVYALICNKLNLQN